MVLVHGLVASVFKSFDNILPVHDVLVRLRDGLRGFRDRDILHEGSLRLGALGILPRCEQSPSFASATLSLKHDGACFALGLRDEVVVDFFVGIHVVLSCADEDLLVCTLGHLHMARASSRLTFSINIPTC